MSRTEELGFMPLAELAGRVASRELSPLELAEALLERIEALDGEVNAYCALDPARVLDDARRAEAAVAAGTPLGPLHGVPVAVKDLIFARDEPTTGGSVAYRDFRPAEDDVVVERLREAGALVLGKTNASEFGVGGNRTATATGGTTRNPWDLSKTTGGSSGGSGAAVAAGMAPAAIGSDGGGSIRLPSSFCGIYGLKPSFGRIPLYPGCRDPRYPGLSAWESLEHLGPMTRTVADAALLMDVLAGPDPRDRHSMPREVASFAEAATAGTLAGRRVGLSLDLGGLTPVDPAVRLAVTRAAEVFESLGARVEPVEHPFSDPMPAFTGLVPLEFDLLRMKELVRDHRGDISPRIVEWVETDWSGERFSEAITRRKEIALEVASLFRRVDLLLTPTLPVPAFDVDAPDPAEVDGKPVADPLRFLQPFLCAFNLAGNPAASIPCGWTDTGLPIGLQVAGPHLADVAVLQASYAYESAAPWHTRKPPTC